MLQIENAAGRRFTVACIRKGDRFGLDDCLVHERDEPLVEFYDADDPRDEPPGRFVARYYAGTLLGGEVGHGLQLCGRRRELQLDPEALKAVKAWIRAGFPE